MFAVVFEVLPSETGYQRYLDIAASLRPQLDRIDGFLSIERFKSLTDPGWILSLSLWRDEAALIQWRGQGEHHAAQAEGRNSVFADYRLRVLQLLAGDLPDLPDAPLVGLQPFSEPAAPCPGKRYQSLANAGKHVDLVDFADAGDALAWRERVAGATQPQAHVLCGSVLRDYGLFDRRQAPQHFPAVDRQR